uniref:Chondroitin proteoglycan 4 domain-containing protein n=1 Tax=Panagrolaimus superbus TaxID=310955 RepID=A0A914YNL4_9BILA
MNKLYFTFVFAAFFVLGFAHPAYRKEFDKILDSNGCLKSCMKNLTIFDEEISLMKNPNLQRYFGKIDDICAIISSTRECIDQCGIESNPFALESMNVICLPEIKEKIDKINDCLATKTKTIDIYQKCASKCGDYNVVNDQVHHLTQSINEAELKENEKVNPIMDKTNEACGIFKCATKCNVETIKFECDKEAGEEVQGILQQIFNTHFNDLQKLDIVEKMSKTIPPQCNYMWDPSAIFSVVSNEANSKIVEDLSNPQENLGKLQFELLLKQLKLVDKQDELINRENQKLDMEMDLLSQKLNHKQQQQQPKSFEESRFIFN